MTYDLLISAEQLQQLLADKKPVRVFDCSFDLSDAASGHRQYLEAHIPASVYAHLDIAMSDKHGGVSGGRHPLPTPLVDVEMGGARQRGGARWRLAGVASRRRRSGQRRRACTLSD